MTDPFSRAADGKDGASADPVAQRIVERGRAERARRDEAKAPRKDAGVLVIGLGRFGTAIAATLDRQDREVLVVDTDPVLVQQVHHLVEPGEVPGVGARLDAGPGEVAE